MRRAKTLAPLFLCSCTTAQPPVHGETPGRICNARGANRFIGQTGSSESGAAIVRATNSAVLRWAPPGVMLTMDYSPSRVTVRLGPDGKIISINCG